MRNTECGLLSCCRQTEKAWIHHPGWEGTMQKLFEWLEERMKNEDEKEKMEEMHQHKVKQKIKSAEGSAGASAQDHEIHSMERMYRDSGKKRRKVLG